ncbi:MAG: hypothetical protein LBU23_00645, partial [Planctomycetota bacterium]|nr:hypothetical protein [Planctomycetota bacterium]
NPRIAKLDDNTSSDIIQNAFGLLAIDTNEKGYHWEMNREPTCPNCGEAERDRWRDWESIDIDLFAPTFHVWENYDASKKIELIDQFLRDKGYKKFLFF